MNSNEELLHRCFDADLNDNEMKKLFLDLSKNADLRNTFRKFQSLQHDLHMLSQPAVPASLDARMSTLRPALRFRQMQDRPLLRRIVSKKISLSLPALAAAFLLMIMGGYFAVTNVAIPKPKVEYVYVVEMPAYIVQSNYTSLKNN